MVNQQTLDAYKAAGVDYPFKGMDEHLKNEREKTSFDNNKTRKIIQMFRFRTNENEEYILYRQNISAISNLTKNKITWYEDYDETSMYFVPLVEHRISYDQETEKQTIENKQIESIEKHYLIKFSEEEANKLKPFTNLGTKYFVRQEDGIERTVASFDEWVSRPFDELISYIPQVQQTQQAPTPATPRPRVSK